MKTAQQTSGKNTKRQSMILTLGLHGLIGLAGLIPLATQKPAVSESAEMVVPVMFFEPGQSSENPQTEAPKPSKVDPEPVETHKQPATEAVDPEPQIVQADTVNAIDDATTVSQVKSDEPSEAVAESPEQSNDGSETGDPFSGIGADGTITRKIVYREDIAQAAHESGVIVIDLCINRQGKILAARNNPDRTTITDMDIVREALDIATRYRFEEKYTAAQRECGSLTFIFDVQKSVDEQVMIASAE